MKPLRLCWACETSLLRVCSKSRPLIIYNIHKHNGVGLLARSFAQTHSSWRPQEGTNVQRQAFIEDFKNSLSFPPPTHDISELDDPSLEEQEVVLHGYKGDRKDVHSRLSFIEVISKEGTHKIQVISSPVQSQSGAKERNPHGALKNAKIQTPLVLRGRLKSRERSVPSRSGCTKILSKEVEMLDVQILNEFPRDINMSQTFPPEFRYLQLRADVELRQAIAFRSEIAGACRDWLQTSMRFVEIETPLLFKSTSEGAREFLVPTRRKGYAYALPQSPQQFKQMLIASGFSRYFQLARCFRDEDLRADRQPEFTQLDLEMSFATGEDVMTCVESLMRTVWSRIATLQDPFLRITYQEAMSKYGSDKPDLRLNYQIFKINHLLPADLVTKISPLNAPAVDVALLRTGQLDGDCARTRSFVSSFLDHADAAEFNDNPSGAPGVFVYDSTKPLQGLHAFGFEAAEEVERILEPEEGDLILLQARPDTLRFSGGSTALGRLILALRRSAVAQGLIPLPEGFHPLWVTDFPLFSPVSSAADEPGQSGTAGLRSTHHPFTSPKTADDVDCLQTDPTEAIADHYDLVINGVELGGGSRRIHNADMQRYVMEEILKMPPEKVKEFEHLLSVLKAGCPPHAGFALGFDRMIAVMLGKDNVRDVIAFPKSSKGEDMVVGAPSKVSKEDWRVYGLKVEEGKKS